MLIIGAKMSTAECETSLFDTKGPDKRMKYSLNVTTAIRYVMLCNVYSVLRNIVTLFTEKYKLSAFTDRFFAHFFAFLLIL